jgi:hypothetical protein
MNFALNKKYSEIDFEHVRITDLLLIGGGCGGGGGGGGSTTITTASVQAAAQSAASAQGANASTGLIVNPSSGGYISVCWGYAPPGQPNPCETNSPSATVTVSTGHVSSSSGGFWSSVGSFFSWLFGSH